MPLYFEEFHPGQAQTLVLIHGGGLSSKQWQPQVDCLADFHILLPDLPEQGKTPGEFEIYDAARKVAELIESRAHGGKAHVVGLSLGGAVVMALMDKYPARIQTALVTGTSGKIGKMIGQVMIWSAGISRFFSAKWLTDASIKSFGIESYRDLVYDDLLRAADPGFNRRLAQSLMALDLPAKNTIPLLVLVGEKETSLAKQAARKIFHDIFNARAATVPGVGHVWNLQKPGLFCEVVKLWALEQKIVDSLQPMEASR